MIRVGSMEEISTHTPLAGRDLEPEPVWVDLPSISTHTPLAGRDMLAGDSFGSNQDFYSHAPRGARLEQTLTAGYLAQFLLTRPAWPGRCEDFYSHAPRGARLNASPHHIFYGTFLLTRPSRGATQKPLVLPPLAGISTHTPLAGRDKGGMSYVRRIKRFLLTRPSRGATGASMTTSNTGMISTHTPLAGRDVHADKSAQGESISTHTPLAGRDRFSLT